MEAVASPNTNRQLAESGTRFGYDGHLFPYKFFKQENGAWVISKYDQPLFGVKNIGYKGFVAFGDIAGKFVEVTIAWNELHFLTQ